ncbi:hypothetical protein LY76DRAFT_636281 [Colletotrichum caudatum]|nr:hypothetical protein LY76DRAFT_636281 [Colletotrichum caudatum]
MDAETTYVGTLVVDGCPGGRDWPRTQRSERRHHWKMEEQGHILGKRVIYEVKVVDDGCCDCQQFGQRNPCVCVKGGRREDNASVASLPNMRNNPSPGTYPEGVSGEILSDDWSDCQWPEELGGTSYWSAANRSLATGSGSENLVNQQIGAAHINLDGTAKSTRHNLNG